MTMDGEIIALGLSLAIALWGFYASWAFRKGRLRQSARWYFDRHQPDFVRNMPFAALPVGIAFMAAAVVIVAGRAAGFWADVAVAIGSLTLVTGLIVMVVFIVRPPRFLKPHWLREREESLG
jgi:threonine/homoserine/homoserine lactone efflux protein